MFWLPMATQHTGPETRWREQESGWQSNRTCLEAPRDTRMRDAMAKTTDHQGTIGSAPSRLPLGSLPGSRWVVLGRSAPESGSRRSGGLGLGPRAVRGRDQEEQPGGNHCQDRAEVEGRRRRDRIQRTGDDARQ